MDRKPYLSVVIPAYRESKRIGDTLLSLEEYFKDKNYGYEIIVVNDGSPDDTGDVVLSYKDKVKNLILVNNGHNRGKGYAVRTGMTRASGVYRLFMDADHSVHISHIESFLTHMEKYDVVVGSIALDASKITEKAGWHRRFLSRFSKALIHFFANPGVIDTQRGFKLFSERAARVIFEKQTIERFGFDIELLVIAKENNFRIKEVPVVWINSAGSTVTLLSYFSTFRELFIITFNKLARKYKVDPIAVPHYEFFP